MYILRFVSDFINKIIVGYVSPVTTLMNFKMFRDTHNIFIKDVYKCSNSFMSLCIDKCVLEWRLLEKPDTDRQRATERRLCFVPCSFFFLLFFLFLSSGWFTVARGWCIKIDLCRYIQWAVIDKMLWDVLSMLCMTGMICVENIVGEIDRELVLNR